MTATTSRRGRKPAIDRDDVLHILGYYDDLALVAERLGVTRGSLDVWMRRNGVAIPQHIRIATADRMSAMQMRRRDGIRR